MLYLSHAFLGTSFMGEHYNAKFNNNLNTCFFICKHFPCILSYCIHVTLQQRILCYDNVFIKVENICTMHFELQCIVGLGCLIMIILIKDKIVQYCRKSIEIRQNRYFQLLYIIWKNGKVFSKHLQRYNYF
jgi:hypothetical protein